MLVAVGVTLWTQQCYADQTAAALERLAQECDQLGVYLMTESISLTSIVTESCIRTTLLRNIVLLNWLSPLDQGTELNRW